MDLPAGDSDGRSLSSLTELVNLLLAGKVDEEVNRIIYGGRLLAMSKKGGGVRPIAVGYVLRCLAAKCANSHVIEQRCRALQPRQVGVGVAGGAEAAVHARRHINQLPPGHAIIKLDFYNAFNSIGRDLLLDTVPRNMPELYRFTLATYSCEPSLTFGDQVIPSREGSQQGDPLSALKFCESIQPVINELDSDLEIGFMDDLSLSSDLPTLAKDVKTIIDSEPVTGLRLNASKCEIISEDFNLIESFEVFKDFARVTKEEMTLLGAPILQGPALDRALQIEVDDLTRAVDRLIWFTPMTPWSC